MRDRNAEAQEEIRIMELLARKPMTRAEVILATGLPVNFATRLISGLKEAECIYRVPGTHRLALS